MKTGLVWDERFMWYDFGCSADLLPGNFIQPGVLIVTPESKRRIFNLLASLGMLEDMETIKPVQASSQDLSRVHCPDYVAKVMAISQNAGGLAGPGAPMPQGGFEIAALAAGGAITAINAVMMGHVKNAYALIRPPGHHAEKNHGMALCVFNNIAAAVENAIRSGFAKKIAIVDWDAHHGNGAESIFYERDDVLTISIHQDQMIPGRGAVTDCGAGKGEGYNINIPLPPGCGTGAYTAAFQKAVLPALFAFQPDLIVVACGLDAAVNDPTARMLLTPDSYKVLTKMLTDAAKELCGGRLVMVHEGGYEPTTSPFCALAIIAVLIGKNSPIPADKDPIELSFGPLVSAYQELQGHQIPYIQNAQKIVEKYWS